MNDPGERKYSKARSVMRGLKIGAGCASLLLLAGCVSTLVFSELVSDLLFSPPVCGENVYQWMRPREPEGIYRANPDFERIGYLGGGTVSQLHVGESDGFAMIGLDLVWLDLSQPHLPRMKAYYHFPYEAQIRHIDPKRPGAFVTTGSNLWLVDFSDPQNPSLNYIYDSPARLIIDTRFVEDHAYIYFESCGSDLHAGYCRKGLHKVDVSSNEFVSSPVACYSGPPADLAASVVFTNFNAPKASIGDYEVVDAETEGILIPRGDTSSVGDEVGYYDPPSGVVAISVLGEFAYLAEPAGELYIVDVSDPRDPTHIGVYDRSNDFTDLTHEGGPYLYAISGGGSRFEILDISVPSSPQFVSALDADHSFHDIEVEQETVYLLDEEIGLIIFDASDPENLERLGMYPSEWIVDFAVQDELLYLLLSQHDTGMLLVVDATNPTAPEVLHFTPLEHEEPMAIAVSDDILIVASNARTWTIFDVSVPANLRFIGEMDTVGGGTLAEVAIHGDFAYLARKPGISVVDISDPAQAEFFDRYVERRGGYSDLAFDDDYFYVSKEGAGFVVLRLNVAD